jgi:hypothetical protein
MTRSGIPRRVSIALAACLVLATVAPASADLASATVTLSGEELRLVAENPALLRLGESDPALLRQVLDRIEAVAPESAAKGLTGALLQPDTNVTPAPSLSPVDQALVKANPALARTLRESPEAALDLIRLIKQAAQGK